MIPRIYLSVHWLIFTMLIGQPFSYAATIAEYHFDSGTLSSSAPAIAGLNISAVATDSSLNSFTSNSGWNSAAQISGAAGFFSSPDDYSSAGNAMHFTVTADPGYRFSLDAFSFLARSTATAPASIGFKIGDQFHDLSATYSNNSTITSLGNHSLGVTDLNSVTIAILGWNATGAGALQVDDIILSGTVIPEPATATLCLVGMLILLRRKR